MHFVAVAHKLTTVSSIISEADLKESTMHKRTQVKTMPLAPLVAMLAM